MPAFVCRTCVCVENSACSNYFMSLMQGEPTLCSECDPDTGKWHGRFAKRSAVGMLVDNEGHVWSDASGLPSHKKILGAVLPPAASQEAQ
jgi:hypothetical protein